MTVFAVFFFLWDFDAVVAPWIGVWNDWDADAYDDDDDEEEEAEDEDEAEDEAEDSSASNSWGRS